MNKELKNIDEAIKNILTISEDDEVLKNLSQISRSIRIVKENWYNISSLVDANRKLVDDKNMVIADIIVLIKYIEGDSDLSYQAKNIIDNYKSKRWVSKYK